MVVMGTIIRETIGTIAESRKTGFSPVFMGTAASYTDLIHKLGGKGMDGFYSTMTVQNPYLDEASQPLRFWANKYKTKFNDDPSVLSVYGYIGADLFIKALEKAGPNLTTDAWVKAADALMAPTDIFGSPPMSFTSTKRLGSDLSRLSQIQDGKWKVVIDYSKKS
jgi:branched-chain amino acid transport system substrate-binding protein